MVVVPVPVSASASSSIPDVKTPAGNVGDAEAIVRGGARQYAAVAAIVADAGLDIVAGAAPAYCRRRHPSRHVYAGEDSIAASLGASTARGIGMRKRPPSW
jgi:hypothetical protein